MHCETNMCGQHSENCPTPWHCSAPTLAAEMHRFPPPITKEGAASYEFEERRARPMPITMEEPSEFGKDLAVALAQVSLGAAVLMAIVGAVAYLFTHWPRLVALLS